MEQKTKKTQWGSVLCDAGVEQKLVQRINYRDVVQMRVGITKYHWFFDKR